VTQQTWDVNDEGCCNDAAPNGDLGQDPCV
jgi:hypothetical protein